MRKQGTHIHNTYVAGICHGKIVPDLESSLENPAEGAGIRFVHNRGFL